MPPSMGMAKTEARTVSAAGENDPRPVQPSVVATEAETRAMNLPGEAKMPSMASHTPTALPKKASAEFQRSLNSSSSLGGPEREK